jgi:predicted permease
MLGGRLMEGVTRQAAAAELQTIVAQQDAMHAGRKTSIVVSDGSWFGHPQMRSIGIWTIPLMLGAVGCVVLIACANVAALLLARAAARQREVAIRLALGAGRARLIRMLLCESVLLASIAGLGSLYLAYQVPILIRNTMQGGQEPALRFDPDWHVFLYLAAVTLAAGCLAGMAPALESLRVQLVDSLKGRAGFSTSKSGSGAGMRRLLVGTQVALSAVLLTGAGVMARGAQRILESQGRADLGQVVLARISMPRQTHQGAAGLSTHRAIESRVLGVPGVAGVAWTSPNFFQRGKVGLEFGDRQAMRAGYMAISKGFFATMGVPILRGRDFSDSDSQPNLTTQAAIFSESLARQMWPTEDPLGKVVHLTGSKVRVEVVGVAKSTVMDSWGEDEGPLMYMPWRPDQMLHLLAVRSGGGVDVSNAVAAAVKSEMSTAVVEAKSVSAWMDVWTLGLRRLTRMVALLGAVALLLTLIGIYGAAAFAVSRRNKEIGIRMALGARRGEIVRRVVVGELRPILAGAAAGVLLALPASVPLQKLMERSPFVIDTRDPVAYGVVCGTLIAVAMVAMLGPARRAAGLDPLVSLREE